MQRRTFFKRLIGGFAAVALVPFSAISRRFQFSVRKRFVPDPNIEKMRLESGGLANFGMFQSDGFEQDLAELGDGPITRPEHLCVASVYGLDGMPSGKIVRWNDKGFWEPFG